MSWLFIQTIYALFRRKFKKEDAKKVTFSSCDPTYSQLSVAHHVYDRFFNNQPDYQRNNLKFLNIPNKPKKIWKSYCSLMWEESIWKLLIGLCNRYSNLGSLTTVSSSSVGFNTETLSFVSRPSVIGLSFKSYTLTTNWFSLLSSNFEIVLKLLGNGWNGLKFVNFNC